MSPRTISLLIAQEQEFFAKQGIEARIVLIKGAPTLVASLISGDIEVGYVKVEDLIDARLIRKLDENGYMAGWRQRTA
jgi:ABC-type nitrate/sulfonate/bicarbonate transport system substrate-binding protein